MFDFSFCCQLDRFVRPLPFLFFLIPRPLMRSSFIIRPLSITVIIYYCPVFPLVPMQSLGRICIHPRFFGAAVFSAFFRILRVSRFRSLQTLCTPSQSRPLYEGTSSKNRIDWDLGVKNRAKSEIMGAISNQGP